jgi:hypothetical protein
MNHVLASYNESVQIDRELRESVRSASFPPLFTQSYEKILLSRPTFIGDSTVRQFANDLTDIFRILVSLPSLAFGGSVHDYCTAVGITGALRELMTRGDDVTGPPLFGRSDAYLTDQGFQLLEFNIGTELGGMDFAELNHALLKVPAFHAFAERHELAFVDTADVVAGVLREQAARVTDSDRPVVVLLETTGGLAHHFNFRSVAEAMCARGLDFRLGEVQDLRLRGGKLVLDGTPVDVAMRFYAAGEILEAPGGADLIDPVLRAHADGGTVCFTGLGSSLYNTKGGLALLRDSQVQATLTAGERATVDRVVPWTRMLCGGDPGLLDRCRAERGDLIVKPSVGWGAAGAVRGADTDDRSWSALLGERLDRGYVVQRIVRPRLETVWEPDEPGPRDWAVNWGVFVTPHGYAGSFNRALKPEDGTIITFGNKGTRGTCAFTFPDGAR